MMTNLYLVGSETLLATGLSPRVALLGMAPHVQWSTRYRHPADSDKATPHHKQVE